MQTGVNGEGHKPEDGKHPLAQSTLSPSQTVTEHGTHHLPSVLSLPVTCQQAFHTEQRQATETLGLQYQRLECENKGIGGGLVGVYDFKFFSNEHVDSLGIPLAV